MPFLEFFAFLACAILLWLGWQLYRAKQFTKFKWQIDQRLKPLVVAHIKEELANGRSELFPNNHCHQQATIFYWCQYRSRIVQAAIHWHLVEQDWLEKTGNVRHCQHLFFIEKDKLATFHNTIKCQEATETLDIFSNR